MSPAAMADAIPELLARLRGDDAAEQRQAARQLGRLACSLASESPEDLPQLEAAVPLLAELLDSEAEDSQTVAAWALLRFAQTEPTLVELLRSASTSHTQGIAGQALLAMLGSPTTQAATDAGAAAGALANNAKKDWWAAARALSQGLLVTLRETAAATEHEGEEAQQAQSDMVVQDGFACLKEMVEDGAPIADLLHDLLLTAFEQHFTDAAAGLFARLMRTSAEQGVLQGPDVEEGVHRAVSELDDLSVDVPKAPIWMGEVLGGLVAGGGADLAAVAEHIRTADANPDEIYEGENTMLVGGGGAAKAIGALLCRLAAETGEEAASEAWRATGLHLVSFLPAGDREYEEELAKLVATRKLGFLREAAELAIV